MINWNKITHEDMSMARQAAKRAIKEFPEWSFMDVEMDIQACHVSGCSLNLGRLLDFDDFNFFHDIVGIRNNLNRENGKLENCFLPRCAA
jgi:hypothetical protein